MITISIIAVLKVFMLLVAALFAGIVILYPRNDHPTSATQYVVFFAVMAVIVDLLFIHYFPFTVQLTL